MTRLGAQRGWGPLAAVLLVLAGCDGGGAKRDAQYQRLVGTWEVRTLRQGRIAVTRDLQVRLTFREGTNGRSYRLRHVPGSGDTTTVQGSVDLLGPNTLSMSGGFPRPLVWSFTFDEPDELNDTVRFSLQSRWRGSAQAFLSAIGRSGTRQGIELDLRLR
ncbi:MAG: hypothetical protein ABEL97_12440 [Salinibacter sp.]